MKPKLQRKDIFLFNLSLHYFSGQEAFASTINPACPISVSTIRRRNIYGETLLHRAVAHQDIDLVRKIIKAHGNVNVRDYAGKLQ